MYYQNLIHYIKVTEYYYLSCPSFYGHKIDMRRKHKTWIISNIGAFKKSSACIAIDLYYKQAIIIMGVILVKTSTFLLRSEVSAIHTWCFLAPINVAFKIIVRCFRWVSFAKLINFPYICTYEFGRRSFFRKFYPTKINKFS